MSEETPRQRFLRNHEENIRMMQIARRKAMERADERAADLIGLIIDKWHRIGAEAEREEAKQKGGA